MLTIATGATRFKACIGAPLYDYLNAQLLEVCAASSPGAATQRMFVNGDGTGGLNPNLYINQFFDASGVASYEGGTGVRVYISPHHYLTGLGAAHGSASIAGVREIVGNDTLVYYTATPYTGPLIKLLPRNTRLYLGQNYAIPAFARQKNTRIAGEEYFVQPVLAFHELNIYTLPPQPQFPVGHVLYAWQQQTIEGTLSWGGDSGSPVFCMINGEAVIMSFTSVGGFVGRDRLDVIYWDIRTAMVKLALANADIDAQAYALLEADLTFLG